MDVCEENKVNHCNLQFITTSFIVCVVRMFFYLMTDVEFTRVYIKRRHVYYQLYIRVLRFASRSRCTDRHAQVPCVHAAHATSNGDHSLLVRTNSPITLTSTYLAMG